ncbi:FtsX-like permease family protein [Pseudomonas vanderleydeniana]|uniref:FtsX-like permease family protein n=1 Tax=Pseudomonas vanderleydeniana TaxID=2745495 RepID=A0A9E6PRK8_9PSED|nr:FtsX-like permease family protein [Pseudomonas vanderleydeniana]QXI31293.1 FtsX-like permease family protein [Pseudomonas vanderleydeniana]
MRTFYWALLALLSHWWRHRVQLASVLAGLWLATALLIGVQALNSQARDSYARASQLIGGAAPYRLVSRDGGHFEQQLFVQLRLAGWPVSPLLQGRLELDDPRQPGHPQRLQVLGVDPVSLPRGSTLAGQSVDSQQLLAFIGVPGQTWVAADTLQRLGLKVGDRPHGPDGQLLPPLALRPQLPPGLLLMDVGAAQEVLNAPGQLSQLLLATDFARTDPPLPADLVNRLRLQAPGDESDLAHLTESFHLNLSALGFLAFIVGLFIVHGAIGLALEQRRGLLRTLRSCGVSARCLLSALTVELLGFALVGGVLGVVSGYGLASLLLPDVAASLRGLYGAEVAGSLNLPAGDWLAGLGLSVGGALLAGAGSVWRAARLPLLALAQAEAWRTAQARRLRQQFWLAVALALVVPACIAWGNSLASGFALMAALLIAAALLLPVCLNVLLSGLLPACRRPLSQWFIADSRQQLPALSLALMALLLALAANIGVGSMTSGFRQTFTNWLDQRLFAQLYITTQDAGQDSPLEQWLAARGDVQLVMPGWDAEISLQGWPTQVRGIPDVLTYRQHWPLLESAKDAWEQWGAGEGVMVSEQLARHLKLELGQQLVLPTPVGDWSVPVLGVYADYGNPKGHLLLEGRALQAHWPELRPTRYNLLVAPEAVAPLKQALQQTFHFDEAHLIDQSELKDTAAKVFERTFAATTALNSLTLGVAGVALFISLLSLSESRLAQLAPLWALGVGRRHLLLLSLGQTLLLGSLTLLLAIPLGLALAWCLVAVVNVQAFGWRLPMLVFPWQLLHLSLMALLVTLVAAAWPLWKLLRVSPVALLRTFANER